MLFNSFDFVLFFCVVYFLYLVLDRRAQNTMLLIASYFFYGYWDWRFLSILIFSTLIDYGAGLKIQALRERDSGSQPTPFWHRKMTYLHLSLILNLGLLAVFKYYNFFLGELKKIFPGAFSDGFSTLDIIVPIGISFYTFQTISYTVDVYRGSQRATRNLIDFALYVSFFPQLLAGPIERAKSLLPQIQGVRVLDRERLINALGLLVFGYFQKVVVADNLSPFVDQLYDNPRVLPINSVALSIYAAMIQIYCDFAGYSNIARGLAGLMGFDLSVNFYNPFFSTGPQMFWQRWHRTLTLWISDYVYRPLSRYMHIRLGRWGLGLAVVLSTTVFGAWHGANWTFIIWGLVHGVIYLLYHVARRHRSIKWKFPAWLLILIWLQIWYFSGQFYRINHLSDLWVILSGFARPFRPEGLDILLTILIFGGILMAIEWAHERRQEAYFFSNRGEKFRLTMIILLFFLIAFCGVDTSRVYVYFQF